MAIDWNLVQRRNESHIRWVRFLANGPEVPAELIAAQERGETLFICGAGISRTVGLPLFRGLVEGVYRSLGEDWNLHPAERYGMERAEYDRVLRSLERRLATSGLPGAQGMRRRIRMAVRDGLAPPPNADLTNHLALLRLGAAEPLYTVGVVSERDASRKASQVSSRAVPRWLAIAIIQRPPSVGTKKACSARSGGSGCVKTSFQSSVALLGTGTMAVA